MCLQCTDFILAFMCSAELSSISLSLINNLFCEHVDINFKQQFSLWQVSTPIKFTPSDLLGPKAPIPDKWRHRNEINSRLPQDEPRWTSTSGGKAQTMDWSLCCDAPGVLPRIRSLVGGEYLRWTSQSPRPGEQFRTQNPSTTAYYQRIQVQDKVWIKYLNDLEAGDFRDRDVQDQKESRYKGHTCLDIIRKSRDLETKMQQRIGDIDRLR